MSSYLLLYTSAHGQKKKTHWTVFVFRIIYLVISQAIQAFRSLLSIFLFFKQKDLNCLLGLLVFQHPYSCCFTMNLNHESNCEWTVNMRSRFTETLSSSNYKYCKKLASVLWPSYFKSSVLEITAIRMIIQSCFLLIALI